MGAVEDPGRRRPDLGRGRELARRDPARERLELLAPLNIERVAGSPATLWFFGAADRIRTGDVQLGKLAFCH